MSVIGRAAPFLMSSRTVPTLAVTSGLLLWLDAYDATTLTMGTGSEISGWKNKVGSLEDFTQPSTSNNRPSLTSGLLDLPCVDFGSTILFYRWLNNATGISITQESTVYMAIYWHPLASSKYKSFTLFKGESSTAISGGNGMPWWGIYSVDDGNTSAYIATQLSGSIYKNTTSQVVGQGTRAVATIKTPNPTSTLTMRLDGSNQSVSGLSGTPPGGMLINSIGTTDNTYMSNGAAGEILVYNSVHDATDTATVEAYLKAKWGTP